MKRISLILTVTTFLIAIFFFGKWAHEVYPRYEIRKEIVDATSRTSCRCENGERTDFFMSSVEVKEITLIERDEIENYNEEKIGWGTDGFFEWWYVFSTTTANVCYRECRVRIN